LVEKYTENDDKKWIGDFKNGCFWCSDSSYSDENEKAREESRQERSSKKRDRRLIERGKTFYFISMRENKW